MIFNNEETYTRALYKWNKYEETTIFDLNGNKFPKNSNTINNEINQQISSIKKVLNNSLESGITSISSLINYIEEIE